MRPAFSVLFLTTLIGIGQGLLVALVAGQWYFVIGSGPAREGDSFYALGALIAVAFLALGLFASFFHLANPQRAWRAAAGWRTSWLSREVLLLPAVMAAATLYAAVHWFGIRPVLVSFSNQKSLDLTMAVGFVAAGGALLLFVATGMIYACVRFVREWASGWTVVNFIVLGLASGFTCAAAYAAWFGSLLTDFMLAGAQGFTLLGLFTRFWQVWRNHRLVPVSTLKSAIGLRHDPIRQLTQGFLGQSFNTTEFRAPGGPDAVKALTAGFLFLAFLLPAALLAKGWASGEPPFILAALVVQYAGLMAERWVFFAQGRHVQNLYYQARA